ncbi:MAG: uroporphyrinogen decarboxylase family protein [Candidatus Zipacnadales bacterium]
MTSRERVWAALRHQETDRVPIDFGGMRSTGIMALAYHRLVDHLGLEEVPLVYDVVQQLAQPSEAVLEALGVDVVDLGRAFLTRSDEWQEWVLPDGSPARIPAYVKLEREETGGWIVRAEEGVIFGRMPASAAHFSQCYWPLADIRSPEEIGDLAAHRAKVTWMALPSPPWHLDITTEAGFLELQAGARRLYESTNRAIMAAFGGNFLEGGQFLCGMQRFLEILASESRLVDVLLDRLLEDYMAILPRFLEAVGPYVQVIQVGDDLGMQTGLQISPATYRRFIKPRHKVLYSYIREHFDGFLFLHSCGSLRELLPDLIEVGVQIINPVQTSAAGMDPRELKREFGRELCFWGGGCETQSTLRGAIPQQVRAEVRERVRIFSAGGGYVFNQVHNVLSDVPPENVVAMFEAARQA